MKHWEAIITYARTCRLGGIESATACFEVFADTEDDATYSAGCIQVNDTNYLYRMMTEVQLTVVI